MKKEMSTDEEVKRLLILLLFKLGATSDDIAVALEMHPGSVRKAYPFAHTKKTKNQ